ncbi:MAG: polysaccharide biosynthesis C-terminal domain-containing protein, partial [Clostridia bacterium]|nr:polysaccharide biosynthesis C-terminal domain-containing protein [Clostridia bacterium]
KLLVFLLLPLYSSVLTTGEYGIATLVADSSNLLFPIVTLGVSQAVFRYSYGNKKDRPAVFTAGLTMLFTGMAFFVLISPLLKLIPRLSDYVLLLGMYVFMFALNTLCGSLLRGMNAVKPFAIKGIICTASNLIFNIIFLLVFRLGITGYLLANICGDFVAVLYMVIGGDLLDYIEPRQVTKKIFREMLRFSVPLIPTTICWWIVNMSDRFMITYIVGESANGVYAAAYKVPNIMITVTGIFINVWQMSLVNEENRKNDWGEFFTRIYDGFKSVMFVAGAMIILGCRLAARILLRNDFYEAWQYMPYLAVACIFEGITSFVGVIYIVKKKSVNSLICASCGAAANVVLNLILINYIGAMGAAIATMMSYMFVFFVTTYRSRELVGYKVKLPFTAANTAILLVQGIITVSQPKLDILFSAAAAVAILVINGRQVYATVMEIINKKTHRSPQQTETAVPEKEELNEQNSGNNV